MGKKNTWLYETEPLHRAVKQYCSAGPEILKPGGWNKQLPGVDVSAPSCPARALESQLKLGPPSNPVFYHF